VVGKMLKESGNIRKQERDREREREKKSGGEGGGSRPVITRVVTSNHQGVG